MELVLASNFDDELVRRTSELPVSTFFGGFPFSLVGGGRPPRILPKIEDDGFRRHVEAVHRAGRKFIATVNSSDLGLQEYREGFLARFKAEMAHLLELGVDGFVVALPILIQTIHEEWPDVPISVSTFARIRTVNQGVYFLRLGASTLVLEEANRDFGLIRGLRNAGAEVEILTNQTCVRDCPYRAHHLNTSSLASQPGSTAVPFELPILQCGLEMVRDPTKLISSIWVRPEDLEAYEDVGVTRFKISGRNRTTDWLVRVAEAYAARRYEGNLLDILSFVQVKGPLAALQTIERDPAARDVAGRFRRAYDSLSRVTIDNSAFPAGFLRRIASSDCLHRSCEECGYCPSVAERVLRIDGVPPSKYRPNLDPGPLGPLLERIGRPAPPDGALPP